MAKGENFKSTIHAKDVEISIVTSINNEDYISLTDIAKYKNPEFPADVIKNWLRVRSTIEFLGLWEQLHNQNFKLVEFDHVKIRIIQFFPQTNKLYRIFAPQPIFNDVGGCFGIFISRNIG